ncbi:MAG: SDR family NAD(P)-dependent oxidoreductase [Acidimicrobiia bacterium]
MTTQTALITGASRGLGRALAYELSRQGWRLILDARGAEALAAAARHFPSPVTVVPGDISDREHRAELARAVEGVGRLDLLINNASSLGPSPLPRLHQLDPDELERILAVNTVAPLALFQAVQEALVEASGIVINVSSDAAVEAYPGWGGYGASKAALDQLSAVLAAEHPELRVYAFDPGDMRTAMHQAAFPGEDISDRPEPETVVPAILGLLATRPPRWEVERSRHPRRRRRTVRSATAPLEFELPADRVASQPPEEHGLSRDGVGLLIARPFGITHTRFHRLGDHLRPGDLLVVNTSPTMPAALDARRGSGGAVVHLSTPLDSGEWIVELRRPDQLGPIRDGRAGETLELAGDAGLILLAPDPGEPADGGARLWRARLWTPTPVARHLERHGQPIRYSYVPGQWPMGAYQTVFARPVGHRYGSAEMASAARPFTPSMVIALLRRGVRLATIALHAVVSSLESHEPPRPERYEVPETTVTAVNRARRERGRVIAVGTTVTRALETVGQSDGTVAAGEGWTDLVLGGHRPARVVDGLITGWHPPETSHLQLLEAVAGAELVASAYRAALDENYLWHEFGDSCLLLPGRAGSAHA